MGLGMGGGLGFEQREVVMLGLGGRRFEIDAAEALVTEEDLVEAVGGGRAHGHGLSGEAMAEIVGAVAPGDFAFAFDEADDVVGTVLDRREDLGPGARAGRVAGGGRGHVEGVVWTLLVVDRPPLIEDLLAVGQITQIVAAQDLGLERAMKALFLALGLGMIGSAVEDADAQPDQPDGQRGPLAAATAPGRGVVAEQVLGQAVALKETLQVGAHGGGVFPTTGAQPEQVTGMIIEDGQRMAAAAATQGHMAFEVHLPKLIGVRSLEALPGLMLLTGPRLDPAFPAQERANGAVRGQVADAQVLQPAAQLARTPRRVLGPQLQQALADLRRGLIRRAVRPTGTIAQRRLTPKSETLQPLVRTLATDAEATAQLRDIGVGLSGEIHKFKTQRHGGGRVPRHPPSVTHVPGHLSPMSPVCTRRRVPTHVVWERGGWWDAT